MSIELFYWVIVSMTHFNFSVDFGAPLQLQPMSHRELVYKMRFSKGFEKQKRLLLRWIHHLKSDWMNNMDYMPLSGI